MKQHLQDPGLDYTPDTYQPNPTPFKITKRVKVPKDKKVHAPIISNKKDIELIVPFKKGPNYTFTVYHLRKGPNPYLFPEFKRTRTVDSLLLEGSPSTLFAYEVVGLTQEDIDQVNSLDPYDISGRLTLIKQLNGDIKFHRVKDEIFRGNLIEMDGRFSIVLANELLYFYRDNISSCSDLIIKVADDNPVSSTKWGYYTLNKHRFLTALLLGFKSNIEWQGHHHVPDAYQVTHLSGDSFIFHLEDKYNFHRALVANSKFDYVDPVKVGFGNIYSKDNKSLIDLCLQVSLI